MIAKISSGKDTAGLIRYLYGPGRANEHTDPHLVTSWDGFAPDPGRSNDFNATRKLLIQDLDLRVHQAKRLGRAPKQHVWHCSLRASAEDRILSDDEWGDIARRVVAATGIAPQGDLDGCRWVAVRHADDHIHIAATKVRGDLRAARHWNDYLTADNELAAVEKDYGLQQVIRGDRTAAKRPTRAEQEKALRTGHQRAARERLRSTVRTAVSVATSTDEFLGILARAESVQVDIQYFPSGDIRGYKVALAGDTNAVGEPIWHSGSKLAPDLSLPKIRERLTDLDSPATTGPASRRPNPWHQATAAAEHIPTRLAQSDDATAQAHIAAFGEALDALPLLAPKDVRPELQQAAATFERATRSRIRAQQDQARALRSHPRPALNSRHRGRVRARDAPRRRHPRRHRRHTLAPAPPTRPTGHRHPPGPDSSPDRPPTSSSRTAGRPRPAPALGAHRQTAREADSNRRTRLRGRGTRRPCVGRTRHRPHRSRDSRS